MWLVRAALVSCKHALLVIAQAAPLAGEGGPVVVPAGFARARLARAAVINTRDTSGIQIASAMRSRNTRVISYGEAVIREIIASM